jgi:GTP cyclohydrolase I
MSVDREAAARAVEAFLRAIGRDPDHEAELVGTGARVAAAYLDELCDGYAKDAATLLRSNLVGGTTSIVVLRDFAVATMCPHHLMSASGAATVAFAPNGKLVGVGALAELVDVFAHRLTLQETIGERVVGALAAELDVRWAACRIALTHGCLVARGERKHGAVVETVAFTGDVTKESLALEVVRGRA